MQRDPRLQPVSDYPGSLPVTTGIVDICAGRGHHTATFRFYEELNDFLTPGRRERSLTYRFRHGPAIKDPIEAFGVPHSEIELILVDGRSVGFDYHLADGDRVAVYPMFEAFDVTPLIRLRDHTLRCTAFIVDVNLGRLARKLRTLGFDTAYRNDLSDAQVVSTARTEHRVVLTRDRRLLFHKAVTHGYWVRATDPDEQLREVLARFDLYGSVNPFHRCLECNGEIQPVDKSRIAHRLEPLTRRHYDEFFRCQRCSRTYWKGSHWDHMRETIASVLTPDESGK